jgi:hypothetical protein
VTSALALSLEILGIAGAIAGILTFFRVDHLVIRDRMANAVKPTRREVVMAILTILSLALSSAGIFGLTHQPPGPQPMYMTQWGSLPKATGGPAGAVVASGTLLADKADRFNVAAAQLHWDGREDILDAGHLQKSAPFDIVAGDITMIIPWDRQFAKEPMGSNFYLLLVPKGVTLDRITTLRQAQSMGVVVLQHMSGI